MMHEGIRKWRHLEAGVMRDVHGERVLLVMVMPARFFYSHFQNLVLTIAFPYSWGSNAASIWNSELVLAVTRPRLN